MFESLLANLLNGAQGIQERPEGVAFFRVAKTAYPLSCIAYVALNVPIGARSAGFMHCTYSDSWVKQCVTRQALSIGSLVDLAPALRHPIDWDRPEERPSNAESVLRHLPGPSSASHLLTFPLRALRNEVAFVCLGANTVGEWSGQKKVLLRDFQVLANYFHLHILRIYGHEADNDILVSARELDCLKWMAAGKTAWEASVILGISERTVRFHLNAAREKLNCRTTTQAVAKAISHQLIGL